MSRHPRRIPPQKRAQLPVRQPTPRLVRPVVSRKKLPAQYRRS